LAQSRLSFDANADTPIHPLVLEAWVDAEQNYPGNPASLHREGRRAQGILEDARSRAARLLQCSAKEIIFTSGATEGNNLALLGMADALSEQFGRPLSIWTSLAEHPSVLGPLRMLQQKGHLLTLLPVGKGGEISNEGWEKAATEGTPDLIALQWANNETGVIQPLHLLQHFPSTPFHCDAVQGFGKLPLHMDVLRAETLVLSGHKIYAPKGVGLLRVSEMALIHTILGGGGQQNGVRPGTESPALATALALALELAMEEQRTFAKKTNQCRRVFLDALHKKTSRFQENHTPKGLPNTLNLTFSGLDGRMLLPACDAQGLGLSAGSACSSGAPDPSPVLQAAGLSREDSRSSVRVSFDRNTTKEEAHEGGARLGETVLRLYEIALR
jgi:cysteine desulfurase